MNLRTLKLLTLGIVAFHFIMLVLHSMAHQVLPVGTTPAQMAFIVSVIIVAPLVAAAMIPRFNKGGNALLAISMLGAFVFGVYYHFIADTIDHVAHVALMQPPFWSQMFRVTAYLLAVSELSAAAFAVLSLIGQRQSLKSAL